MTAYSVLRLKSVAIREASKSEIRNKFKSITKQEKAGTIRNSANQIFRIRVCDLALVLDFV